jgi:hypothetical protein
MITENGRTDLQEAVNQLRKMSVQLNEATDIATTTILRVEKFLNEECSIGMWGMVEKKSETDPPETVAIRYDRFESQFRIMAQIRRGDEPVAFKPWVNCNRETKLKSFPMLPGLLNIIAKEGLGLCNLIQETNQIVKALTEAIERK